MSIKGSLGRAWLSVLVLCISLASSLHTHTSTHTTQRPTHNTPYSRLYLRGLERIQTDYGVVQLPDLDFLTPVRDRDRDRHKERPASTSSSSSLNPPPDMSLFRREALAIVYLEQELRLDQAALTKIVLKYPWILYLKVDSNLRPTVEVLRSFGFKDRDVRSIVAQTPSVLAINHAWTLPEKLLSLQRMFHLNRAALVRTVVSQPYLLTSSIDRNLKVAAFLTNRVGLQEEQVRALLIRDPRIAMSSVSLLERCWSALTSLYGLPPPLARKLILRCPLLLSRNVVGDVKGRVEFLCLDLGFAPPPMATSPTLRRDSRRPYSWTRTRFYAPTPCYCRSGCQMAQTLIRLAARRRIYRRTARRRGRGGLGARLQQPSGIGSSSGWTSSS